MSGYNKETEHSRKCPAYNCPMLKSATVDGTETCRYHAAKDRKIWPKISELLNNNIRLLDIIYHAKKMLGHEFDSLKEKDGFELEQALKPKAEENHLTWARRVDDTIYRELKGKIIAMEREADSYQVKRTGVSAALDAMSNGNLRKNKRPKRFEDMK